MLLLKPNSFEQVYVCSLVVARPPRQSRKNKNASAAQLYLCSSKCFEEYTQIGILAFIVVQMPSTIIYQLLIIAIGAVFASYSRR